MPETKRPLKVFLCHASQDKPAVREVYSALKQEGWIDPWLDKAKILPGQNWRIVIEKAVEESDVVIVCLSTQSVSKEGFVQRELKYAYDIALEKPEETIFLIPLRLDQCIIPRGLRSFQWVDYFGAEKNDAYSNLLDALKLRYEQKLTIEEEDHTRQEKERLEREVGEKTEQEKIEREKAEKAAREKVEQEGAEKARKEKAEYEAAEKAAREKAKRAAAEKTKRKRAERRAAQIAALKETVSKFFNSSKLAIPKAKPLRRIGGIIGVIFILFWGSLWAMPKLLTFMPTAKASITSRPSVTNSPMPLTEIAEPNATSTITRTPATTALPTEVTDAKGVPIVFVPAGEFTMGSNNGDEDEKPVHDVYLDAFYMDKYEVTNGLYRACVEAGGCSAPPDFSSYTHNNSYWNSQSDNFPVINVTWNQAKAYCEWRGARLPTEAEWEKAARSPDGHIYPWGDAIDCSYANYSNCKGDMTPVGSYENGKSPYGIYDMAGNVWEWVADWYDANYYATLGDNAFNPQGPANGQYRVLRGGAWSYNINYVRSTSRNWVVPDTRNNFFGLRCASSVP